MPLQMPGLEQDLFELTADGFGRDAFYILQLDGFGRLEGRCLVVVALERGGAVQRDQVDGVLVTQRAAAMWMAFIDQCPVQTAIHKVRPDAADDLAAHIEDGDDLGVAPACARILLKAGAGWRDMRMHADRRARPR